MKLLIYLYKEDLFIYTNNFVLFAVLGVSIGLFFGIRFIEYKKKIKNLKVKKIMEPFSMIIMIIITAFFIMPVFSADKKIKITPFPEENTYIKVANNNVKYYMKTKKGIESGDLDIYKIREKYTLRDNEEPYILYSESSNIFGVPLYTNDFTVFLHKVK